MNGSTRWPVSGRSVSVVIPVRSDAPRLELCLKALAVQTRRAEQIVVVDNASSDLTPIVAERWAVTQVFEQRRGISPAACAGYDAAAGDIIARLDADSIAPADWIERLALAFDNDADVAAVTGPGDFASLPVPLRRLADVLYLRGYPVVFGRIVGPPPVFGSNFAMTRTLWMTARLGVHCEDGDVHDDLDLSFVIPRSARVLVDPSLRVPVSARAFANPVAFVRRIMRGIHTVRVNRS